MKLNYFILLFFAVILYSCSVKRFIPENETLYKGATFKIDSEEKIKDQKIIEEELQAILRPQPNTSKLGLLAHYKVENGNPGFIYRFINKKLGEDPVYQSDVDIKKTENFILNRLENLGFFYSKVTSEIKKGSKKSEVIYTIELKQPYVMETYQLETDTLSIHKEIQKTLPESFIKKGERFNLAKFKIERERIDFNLKSQGYYNFNADFLIFEIDTNQYKNKRFDLYLRLKKNVPKKALVAYKLNTINVYPNTTVTNNYQQADTTTIAGVNFIQDTLFFKPERLRPFVLFEKGQFYDPKKFKATSRRLSSIGTYKFVNVQFEEKPISENDTIGYLNTSVYLSPLNKRALSAELQANAKSNGFSGPALALSYTDRNLFKGGEVLKITGKFGYEAQLGGKANNTGLSSTQLGLTADLVFPRLLFPMDVSGQFKYNIPKTRISAGIEYLNRSKLYSLSSFNTSFGYQWNANASTYHTINPISTNFIKLTNTTPEFETILNDNPFLKNSFEQQLISGLTYNFTYNELSNVNKKNPFYFSSNIDIAGNSLSLFSSKNDSGKKTILGVEFAQYAKIDADARFYFNLGNEQTLVTRLSGGFGYAYGNSEVLPFSRQFFSGGPYSIRAFRTRSIGPGTYAPESTDTNSYFDRSGDIKLEANVEYRFPLYAYFKGALFVDAGNVWLRNENSELPGGKFTSNFINELAIGAGLGVRVDIQGFVVRLDWAAPVHAPVQNETTKYTFDASNGIFNFAIGYPF
ncbi:Outer membrane protein assembly factor BamA [Kordia antarctica]|uniref:Outer membrane protein assembly factor BamA n=1 Tax=Kordia antarctica TaxID=1218801 RepID=A0A7L4ZI55_9FLAO|nr:BamA/TamA family outer membrane protein [Kordia antarctica]QHI36322.1 Outer membrane protein assembly factor BamA [Kordia antarctica]